jgi:hypothetical protein
MRKDAVLAINYPPIFAELKHSVPQRDCGSTFKSRHDMFAKQFGKTGVAWPYVHHNDDGIITFAVEPVVDDRRITPNRKTSGDAAPLFALVVSAMDRSLTSG